MGGVPADQVRSESVERRGASWPVGSGGWYGREWPQLTPVTPHADRHLLANAPPWPPLGGLQPWGGLLSAQGLQAPSTLLAADPVPVRHVALTLGP